MSPGMWHFFQPLVLSLQSSVNKYVTTAGCRLPADFNCRLLTDAGSGFQNRKFEPATQEKSRIRSVGTQFANRKSQIANRKFLYICLQITPAQ